MATTDMTFDEAVSNLQMMFEGIDRELISALLTANGGHMERTVEQLLELDSTAGGAPPAPPAPARRDAAPRAEALLDFGADADVDAAAVSAAAPPAPPVLRAASSSGSHVDPEAAAAVTAALGPEAAAAAMAAEESLYYPDGGISDAAPAAAAPSRASSSSGGRRAAGSGDGGGRRWRHPLPDDFLRVPGRGGDGDGTPSGQMVGDEMVAQMFADELFVQQLMSHPEFADYLDDEVYETDEFGAVVPGRGGDVAARQRRRRPTGEQRPRAGSEARRTTGESFASKLSEMGNDVKRKFNTLMLRFGRNTGGGVGGSTARPAAGRGYATLDADEADGEGSSLLARDDGVELRGRGGGGAVDMGAIGVASDDESDDEGGLTRRRKDD
uniref:CUE domain-containing protein n=1 Tax=Bicosoecida sp. CB-2014 TaxID=1486930 RepID=A0A7S1G3A3_9STRA|mmetsp:Transcript_11884/g.41663  ORF Transcript_11884/g.41663 Transcript_11884/m.41663 type:complete len:384 (+) Transcript_11884:225-1376(+)